MHKILTPFDDASGKNYEKTGIKLVIRHFMNQQIFISHLSHKCYPGRSTAGGDRLPPIICETNFLAQEIELIDN
ncbi:hypothetical protein HCJ48_06515 [Listeria sp. FSL L7-1510]|nr:hypothetical protein [Listeria immobilis]